MCAAKRTTADDKKLTPLWWLTKDGDLDCLDMYLRHYSRRHYADGRARLQFVGPGEKWVFRTERADAVWVWRKFLDDCIDLRTGERQQGVNNAVFRNESAHRSSHLIRQADAIADVIWPHSRHYTYVDTEKVRSANPGYCYLRAGWTRAGRTKGGLLVLERLPACAIELLMHYWQHPVDHRMRIEHPAIFEEWTGFLAKLGLMERVEMPSLSMRMTDKGRDHCRKLFDVKVDQPFATPRSAQ